MTGQSAAQPKCQWTIGDIVAMGGLAVAKDMSPPPHRDETAWFVLSVEPKAERRVADEIRKAELRAYVPLATVLRRTSNRRRYAECPMPWLPGYVFVDALPTPEGWHAARSVRGVNGFVTVANGITPVRVPDEVIGDIMSAEARGLLKLKTGAATFLAVGARVVVLDGEHKGRVAVVVQSGLVSARVRIDDFPTKKPLAVAVDRLAALPY